MRRGLFFIAVGVAVLAALFWAFAPAERPAGPGVAAVSDTPRREVFELRDGKRVQGPAVIAMTQGGVLELQVTTDRDDELHVHGYDRTLPVAAGVSATLRLQLDRAGRFTIELHDTHQVLTTLEVAPA